jgi:hypothetical protein
MSTSSQHSSTSRSRCEERVAAVADVLDKLDHADARGRVQAVGRLIQKEQFGAVGDGLGQLGGLLHAQRIGAQVAVAHLAQSNVEEGFVRALQRVFRRQTGQFGHQPDEAHAAHGGDERIVFRHVADQAANFAGVGADVAAEDAGSSGGGLMETQQRVDEGGLSRAVGPQQADGPAGESGFEILQDGALAKAHFETIQFDDRVHSFIRTQWQVGMFHESLAADAGWQMPDGGWRMADGGWRLADAGCRSTRNERLLPTPRPGAPLRPAALRGPAAHPALPSHPLPPDPLCNCPKRC